MWRVGTRVFICVLTPRGRGSPAHSSQQDTGSDLQAAQEEPSCLHEEQRLLPEALTGSCSLTTPRSAPAGTAPVDPRLSLGAQPPRAHVSFIVLGLSAPPFLLFVQALSPKKRPRCPCPVGPQ